VKCVEATIDSFKIQKGSFLIEVSGTSAW